MMASTSGVFDKRAYRYALPVVSLGWNRGIGVPGKGSTFPLFILVPKVSGVLSVLR